MPTVAFVIALPAPSVPEYVLLIFCTIHPDMPSVTHLIHHLKTPWSVHAAAERSLVDADVASPPSIIPSCSSGWSPASGVGLVTGTCAKWKSTRGGWVDRSGSLRSDAGDRARVNVLGRVVVGTCARLALRACTRSNIPSRNTTPRPRNTNPVARLARVGTG